MELAAGYKQTEVGVIPDDWDVHDLGEIGEPIIGLTYSPKDVASFGTLVLRSSNVQKGRLSFLNNVFVTCEISERIIVKNGDILICVRNGSRDLIGKCAQIVAPKTKMAFGAFMSVYRTEFAKYTFHQFQSDIIQKQINSHLGATINQITNGSLRSFKIPLPPTKAEQEAIAGALSDADAWIESLEQLIAKKRRIKEGAMQTLLTGKQRLPGFSGEWEVLRIRDSLSTLMDYRGRTPRKLGMDWGGGNIRALSAGNVRMGAIDFSQECYFGSEQLYKKWMVTGEAQKGDILMTTEAPLGNVAMIPDNQKYILSQRTILLRPNPSILNNRFLFQKLMSQEFQELLSKDSSGSTATGIQRLKFEKIKINFPSVKEQTAIAEILSDMDTEIDALEAKLRKARQIKQGMMQELLTGKTRLV